MDLTKLIQDSIAAGNEIMTRPVKATPEKGNGIPAPTTWEYLIDALTLVPFGTYLPLKQIIMIMLERGWQTKAATDELKYRTVHSSTYKACRDHRKGHIIGADVIDRSKARDTLYALNVDSIDELTMTKLHAWIQTRAWDTDGDVTVGVVEQSTPEPEQTPDESEQTTDKGNATPTPKTRRTRRSNRKAS